VERLLNTQLGDGVSVHLNGCLRATRLIHRRLLYQPSNRRSHCRCPTAHQHSRPGCEGHWDAIDQRYTRKAGSSWLRTFCSRCCPVPLGFAVGRHQLPLEQCYCDWALLRRSRHALCLFGMGVSQRRYGYDPFLDNEKKGRLVQLPGRILFLWRDVAFYVLSTHLFSGCEGSFTNLKRGLSSAKCLKPDFVLGSVWFSWYVILWNTELLVGVIDIVS